MAILLETRQTVWLMNSRGAIIEKQFFFKSPYELKVKFIVGPSVDWTVFVSIAFSYKSDFARYLWQRHDSDIRPFRGVAVVRNTKWPYFLVPTDHRWEIHLLCGCDSGHAKSDGSGNSRTITHGKCRPVINSDDAESQFKAGHKRLHLLVGKLEFKEHIGCSLL